MDGASDDEPGAQTQPARLEYPYGNVINERRAQRCLAIPLLVKGLEFDHVAILNSADLTDAELVYVGLTRGSRGMIIISPTA
jgi:DNA helicase IV